jgi:hypothetical protein
LVKTAEVEVERERLAQIAQAAQGGIVVYEQTTTYPNGRVEVERRFTPPVWQATA